MNNRVLTLLIIFFAFFVVLPGNNYAEGQAKDNAACGKIKAEIDDLDRKIKRSCDDVQILMSDLIGLWKSYYSKENQRIAVYEIFNRKQWDILKDFIITADKEAKVGPGKFYNLYAQIKNEAREAGLLIDGTPPWSDKQRRDSIRISNAEFAFAPDAKAYFYFGDAEKNEKSKEGFLKRLSEIRKGWEEHKKQYWDFINRDLDEVNKELKSLKDEMAKARAEYFKTAGQLSKSAFSGEYEHCLGKLEPAAASYAVVDEIPKLFIKGGRNTVDGLPGMGLQFIPPTKLPVLAGQDIPDCPFVLNLKRDGEKARAYVEEMLKLELEKQERDTIELGITFVDEAASFVFDTAFHVVEVTAPLGNVMIDIVSHPIDTPINGAKAVIAFTEKVIDRGYIYKVKSEGGIGTAIGNALESTGDKLGNLGTQLAQRAVDQDRFTIKPDDPPQKRLEKLMEQVDSARQVNEGLKEMAKVTGEIAILWKGDTAIRKATEGLAAAKAGATGVLQAEHAAAVMTNAKKAEALTGHLNDLKTKNPAAVKLDVGNEAKALNELIEKENEVNKRLRQFAASNKEESLKMVNEPVEKPFTGKQTTSRADITVKTRAGGEKKINLGEQLGKGSTSEAFVDANNDALVIRQTKLSPKGEIASKIDDFGRKALEDDVKSDVVRVAKREGVYEIPGDEFGIERAKKIEVVERVEKTADKIIAEQGGRLTEGQRIAYEQALRDINSKGYAWLDNHPGNFTFEKLPGGDRWRVVVIDTGNIIKATGNTAEELAKNARLVQEKVGTLTKSVDVNDQLAYLETREKILGTSGEPLVDLKAMGLENTDNIGFAVGNVRPDTGGIAKLTDEELRQLIRTKTDSALTDPALSKMSDKKYQEFVQESNEAASDVEKKMKELKTAIADAQSIELKKIQQAATEDTIKKKRASPVPEADEGRGVSEPAAAKTLLLINYASQISTAEECMEFKKLLISGYDPEKLKKMGNPCAGLGN